MIYSEEDCWDIIQIGIAQGRVGVAPADQSEPRVTVDNAALNAAVDSMIEGGFEFSVNSPAFNKFPKAAVSQRLSVLLAKGEVVLTKEAEERIGWAKPRHFKRGPVRRMTLAECGRKGALSRSKKGKA